MLAWVWCKARWRAQRQCGHDEGHHRAKIVKVYAFNETDDAYGYREITRYFVPETWEQDVRDATQWKFFRVEIRYILHKQKYRLVLRQGDVCAWPPKHDAGMVGPRRILTAALHANNGARRDVTGRMNKYFGPKANYHQQALNIHDCFPFDDCEYESEYFETLRLIDHTLECHTYSFANNDALNERE